VSKYTTLYRLIACLVAGLIASLQAPSAAAQQRDRCELPAQPRIADGFGAVDRVPVSLDSDAIVFEAGEVDASFGDDPGASLSGGVILRRGDRVAGADAATIDPAARAMSLIGNVRYEDLNTFISSDSAEFNYSSGRIRFEGAEFQLGNTGARGQAGVLNISQSGELELDDVGYTTCPPGSNDWIVEAGDIDLDTQAGVGTARGVKLRFQGVPILYTPYLSFPLSDARKSGILTPEIGSTGRSGNELSVPYYWNIAPHSDATFTPRLLTARGLQMGTEFRYLSGRSEGIARVDYLPNDSRFNDNRHLFDFDHQTLFRNGWRNRVDFREVSDSQYFEDLGGSLSISSITHLNRSLAFDYFGEHWSMLGLVQDYQTIDRTIVASDKPYRRLPQLRVRGDWQKQPLGSNTLSIDYSLDAELTYFDRDVGTTGWRLNAAPAIELPVEKSGWFFVPGVAFDYTVYELDNTAFGQSAREDRALPIGSVDTGLRFERPLNIGADRVQTLEPRLLYVHVPFRDQDALPVFDTILPDLNLVQLYRKNRFLGVDRLADTDQLSIGVTSRILDTRSGRELMSATIGQARYLSAQGVSLPGQAASIAESSDYIAEVRFLLYDNLNFDVGHQWSGGDRGTTQSEARLQYQPASNKILNLAYRFRRDSLEQGDLSWSWPVSQSWNFVGRYNFSFRDREPLEQFYGLEYESCCWGLRLVSRRYISTRDGTRDSSIGLQLVLKGMTSVGTKADRLLERGILGYSPSLN